MDTNDTNINAAAEIAAGSHGAEGADMAQAEDIQGAAAGSAVIIGDIAAQLDPEQLKPGPIVAMTQDRSQVFVSGVVAALSVEQIAAVAHEVNRAYCAALGDNTQVAWDEAPEWQRMSVVAGVKLHLDNPGISARASHEAWMARKQGEGWVWGPRKIVELKQHPAMLPYDQLPIEQRAKDAIFGAIVSNLVSLV